MSSRTLKRILTAALGLALASLSTQTSALQPGAALAIDDVAVILEDSGTSVLCILDNDTDGTPENAFPDLATPPLQSDIGWIATLVQGPLQVGTPQFVRNTTAGCTTPLPANLFRNNAVEVTVNANQNGTAVFYYGVEGTNGVQDFTTGGCATQAAQSNSCGFVFVNVLPVNDPPTFTPGGSQVVSEDAGAQTVVGWATAMDEGGSTDEDGQNLNFVVVSNSNAGLFSVQPAIDPTTGTLTYRPADDQFGVANIRIVLQDDGGTANGGNDTSGQVVFSITVNPVPDDPDVPNDSFTIPEGNGANETDLDNEINLLSGVVDPDPFDTHLVDIVPVTPPAHASSFTLQPGGDFDYIHNDSENFSDSFTYRVNDSGGGSTTATVNITITEVNDNNPVPASNSFTVLEGGSADETDLDSVVNNLLQGLTDVDTTDSHTVQIIPSIDVNFGTLTLFGDGTFDYTHDGSENFVDSFDFVVEDAGGNTGIETVTITIDPVNENDPVAPDDSFTVAEGDSANETVLDTFSDLLDGVTDIDTGDTFTVNTTPVDDVDFGTLVLQAGGDFDYTHDGSENLTDSFEYEVLDAAGNTTTATVSITITGVNDDPVVTVPGAQNVDEDVQTAIGGVSVSDSDADLGGGLEVTLEVDDGVLNVTASGAAIVTNNDTNTVDVTGLVADVNATLASLLYTSDLNYYGPDTLTVTADDGGNTGTGGGGNVVDTVAITVDPVNDTPVISDITNQVTSEDTSITGIAFTTDEDDQGDLANEDSQTVSATATSSNQTLVPDANITVNFTDIGDAVGGTIDITPAANQNGVVTITVTTDDGEGANNTAVDTFTLTINAANDTPSIVDIINQSVDEDTDLTGLAFTVDEDDQGDLANEDFQVVTVVGTSSNNGLVADSSITENFTDSGDAGGGTLDISPEPDVNGTVTITITVNDGEALNNIVVDTFDLTINPVNDVPTIDAIANQVTNEDVDVVGIPFAVDEGGGSDEDVQNLVVTATSSDQTVVANTGITVNYIPDNLADATGGSIDISPVANGNGVTTITVSVSDGIAAPVTTDFTVTVNAQNDNPVVAAPFADVVVNEDAPNSILDLVNVFDDVDIATNSDTLTLAITGNTNPGLFASIGLSGTSGAIINNTLTIDYAATLHGFSDITIEATDGGTLSVTDTFRVTVNSVPDTPVVANPIADVNVIEEAANTVIDLTTVFDDEDILTDADTLTLSVLSNTNPVLFDSVGLSGATISIINNTLTLDYAADQNGTADITIRATDGLLASVDDTFTVTVTSVNDEPTFTVGADQTSDEDAGAQIVPLFITDGSPGPLDEAAQNLTYTVTNDNNGLFAVQPAISATGQLTYTAATHVHGSATVSVFLSDDGGTANGGDDTSPTQTFDVTINAVADAPTLTVNNAITTDEDVAASLGITTALVDADGSETLSVLISGLPAGAELSDGTNTSSTAVTNVSTWTVNAITVIGALHSDDDFALTVTSTATEASNFDTASSVQVINVTVDGVADAPFIDISPNFVFVLEDTEANPMPIAGISLVDTTNETLVITANGIPAGSMLQDGTNSTTSTGAPIDVTTWVLTNMRLTPPPDDSDDFVVTMSATSTEVNHPTSTANSTYDIFFTVNGVADTPTLTVTPTATTDEDVVVSLGVSGSVVDPSETLTFNISGVPVGATLSGGTDNGGGVWTGITEAEATTLTLTPVAHSDADFTLTVESQSTDDLSTATSASQTIDVTVNAVADVPSMVVTTPATGDEDTAIPLTVATALIDGDGSETLTIRVTGVIAGGTLSAGTDLGGGTWSLTPAQLPGLTLSLPAHVANDFQVEFQSTATEAANSDTALTNVADGRIAVIFNDIADTPNATFPASYSTNEDTNVVLGLTGGLVDTDGSETFYLEVTKVGDGGTISLSNGTEVSTNVWRLTEAQIPGVELILDADNNDDFTLNLDFVAEETDGGDTATVSTSIPVSVTAINDPPIASDLTVSIDENTVNGTVIGTVAVINVEPVGLEPNQTLTFSLPGTAFAIDSSGVVTVADETQLDFETTPVFNLVATVTDSGAPAGMDTANVTISLNSINEEVPVASPDTVSVDELATVNFNVLDNDTDGDMPPNLSVSEVMGNPALVGSPIVLQTGGVDAGTLTVNADGSATFVTNPDNTIEVYDAAATYTLTDGDNIVEDVDITITINPLNDNMPMLTAAGTAYTGETYNEDDSNPKTIILNPFFSDLDIDDDGILDGSTVDDEDSLVFSIVSNSNTALISPSLNGGDLELTTPTHGHGTSTIVVRATDSAAPAGNISSVDLSFDVVVTSDNDAPVYSAGYYVDQTLDEDPANLNVDLVGAFNDADLSDLNPTDDSLTYTVTIIDQPNAYVQTGLVDETGLTGAVVTNDSPIVGQRTIVYTTTASSFALAFNADAHGQADVTIRATDTGIPPEAPLAALPLFDEASFNVTVNSVGDDQPIANDYHYSSYPALVVDEDGDPIIFNPTENDYHGDAPVKVTQAGAEYTDSFSLIHRYRSQTRLADPQDTGTFQIEGNGEVSCSEPGCQDLETADTTVDGSSLLDFQVIYKPMRNFNGEDSFDYCIEDSAPAGEDPFTGPPGDPRCATVTVLVNPVNDIPEYPDPITFVMTQADDLILAPDEGLLSVVKDADNTHIDGLGCNPLLPSCSPGPSDPQPDRMYFRFQSALTDHGQLLPPFLDDGSFQYRPDPTFAGEDFFLFDVCDVDTGGMFDDPDRCILGVQANILIEPLAGAASGSSDDAVEFDFQLADQPLELPVGPEPNVLIITDDSGSMAWDILTDQSNGLYYFETGNYLRYVMTATAGGSTNVAPSEEEVPNQGLWRLRNSTYNTVYYNPTIRYMPWEGLDSSDNEFPDSPPTSARHNPLTSTPTTNLRVTQTYTGQAVVTSPETCEDVCLIPSFFGGCLLEVEVCTGGSGFQNVVTNNYYIPRYYTWIDRDSDGELDATPSPDLDPTNSEGQLVEIRPASEGGSDTYPKPATRTDCTSLPTECTYDEELQNFANWFTYARNREFTTKWALGQVVAAAENMRIGYAKINSSVGRVPITSMNTSERTGAKATTLDAIYQTTSSGGTPLRRALRNAGRHYECVANDIFGSISSSNPGDTACPIQAAPEGNCQQNFTLLMTDGEWNGGAPSIGERDNNNNTNFDGGMFAGSSSDTLADVAMHYYERDLHSSLDNEVPTTGRDVNGASDTAFENNSNEIMHQHMSTYTVGFGVNGLIDPATVPTDYTQSFTWGNPSSTARKIDDLLHAAVNGRGDYLSASNSAELTEALIAAFEEFSQGSGAASAVSFNSQEVQEDTLVFRAFYNTKINTGDLVAVPFTEAGLGSTPTWRAAEQLDTLAPTDREIMTYNPDTGVGIPFRGSGSSAGVDHINNDMITFFGPLEAENKVNYLRGDSALERPVGNFRERPITEGRLGDIVHSRPAFNGPPNRLGRGTIPYPQASGESYGEFASTYATRTRAIYVAANDGMMHAFNAENGNELFAYVPANLMLNPFSQKISDLIDFSYSHKFFVDLSPALNDVYINVDDDVLDQQEWVSMLVGGQGAGAKAYYAIDITDPSLFTEGNADDVVLWEFTEEDDAYPTTGPVNGGVPLTVNNDGVTQRQDLQTVPQPVKDLGYTFSVPTLAMSNLVDTNGNNEWVAIFGNGYNSTSGIAKMFVLFLDGGIDGVWCHPDKIHNVTLNGSLPAGCSSTDQDFVKLDTGFGVQGGFPNGLGVPRGIDIDGNGTLDYAYAGDYFGNFFRFDLTSDDYTQWSVTKIFKAEYTDSGGTVHDQPITTQPIVTLHPTEADGFIVIFATGSYITVPDGTSTEIQSVYGLWDRLSPELLLKSELVQQRYTNQTSAEFGNVRSLSNNAVNYGATGANPGRKGWYNDLDSVAAGGIQGVDPIEFPGERAIRNIQLRGGLGFVNSVIPRSDTSCVKIAGGFALSFCPGTGGTDCLGNRGIFDLNNDGVIDDYDEVNDEVVAGTRFEDAVPTDSAFIEDMRITQLSDQELDITITNTTFGDNTGRLSWKQLDSVE